MATERRSLEITSKLQDTASKGFAQMLAAGRSVAGGLVTAFKGVGIAIGALSSASVAAFVAFRKVSEDLDKVAKSVDRLGVSAESLTSIRNGAKLAGVEFDDLTNSIRFFEKFVDEAAQGGKKQREVLAELGLQAEELSGQNLDLVDVFGKVGDGLNKLEGSAKQTNTLLQVFGRTGSNLAPLLKQGSQGIRQLADEARSMGVVFSREELARVEAFNDAWERIKQTVGALAQQLVVELSPAFTDLFETLRKYFNENSEEIRKSFLDLIVVFVEGFKILKYVVDTLALSLKGLQIIGAIGAQFTETIRGNTEAANAFGNQVENLIRQANDLKLNWGGATDELDRLAERLRNLRDGVQKNPPIKIAVEGDSPGSQGSQDVVPPDAWERFKDGAQQASLAWRDFAGTAYQSGQVLVNGTLNALTDNISAAITRTKTWGQAWKEMGRATLGILAQVITKLLTVKVLSYLFPTAAGGNTGGGGGGTVAKADGGVELGGIHKVMPLRRFALGGIAKGPTLALMGEGSAPAEAFVPLPDGRSIPVSFSGGGGGQTIVINQKFQSTDARGTYELFKRNRGTIRQFVTDDAQRKNGFRSVLKGATR